MIVDWTVEFDQWLDRVEARGGHLLEVVTALLQALEALPARPDDESATFQRIRQARRHELWRVAHPYDPEVAVRVICWFRTTRSSSSRWWGSTRRRSATCSTPVPRPAARRWWTSGSGSTGAMSERTRFVRGNDRIKRLSERADVAPGAARVRRRMAEADASYARGLSALRKAAELTQVELAHRLGVSQAAVSRMEQPHDMLLSTLSAYLQAVGGHGTLVVHLDSGEEVELDLAAFEEAS